MVRWEDLFVIVRAHLDHTLDDSVNALIRIVKKRFDTSFDESACRTTTSSWDATLRLKILSLLSEIHLRGEEEIFFSEYCDELGEKLDCSELQREVMCERFFAYVDAFETGRTVGVTSHFCNESNAKFLILSTLNARSFEPFAAVLSPLLYWLYLPFSPLDESAIFTSRVKQIVKTQGKIELANLHRVLINVGINCELPYLEAFCFSLPNCLLADENGRQTVVDSHGQISDFDLASYGFNESGLYRAQRRYIYLSDGGYISEVHNVEINHGRVQEFFNQRGNSLQGLRIDWFELTAKLIINRRLGVKPVIQGLNGHLHQAIVEVLSSSGRAMRLVELESALCLSIPLSPEILGPGRIMAYSRHVRFLEKDKAFYVLSDWVETDTVKKGKIPRSHIVTPFKDKRIELTWSNLQALAADDVLVKDFDLYIPSRLARFVAPRLPDAPTELYYLNILESLITGHLMQHGSMIAKGYFVPKSCDLFQIHNSIPSVSGRRMFVTSRLKMDAVDQNLDSLSYYESLCSAINAKIPDPNAARALTEFVRS